MRVLLSLIALTFAVYAQAGGLATTKQAELATTPTGIELDTEWKKEIYAFAKKNVVHPSWGTAHSERNYHVTLLIAQKQGLAVDKDILFAAAFLHDLGGMKSFSSSMAENCSSAGCRELAETRKAEMAAFLSNLDRETFGGAAL